MPHRTERKLMEKKLFNKFSLAFLKLPRKVNNLTAFVLYLRAFRPSAPTRNHRQSKNLLVEFFYSRQRRALFRLLRMTLDVLIFLTPFFAPSTQLPSPIHPPYRSHFLSQITFLLFYIARICFGLCATHSKSTAPMICVFISQ